MPGGTTLNLITPAMSDDEQEYEVESVVGARVERKSMRSKKLIWKYLVKWKGYGPGDNTWEPIESFEGSEHILAQFWMRVDPDGRDTDDLSLFKAGEEFLPVGPPRGRKRKVSGPTLTPTSPKKTSLDDQADIQSNGKRRRSSPSPEKEEEPPAKKTRGRKKTHSPSADTTTPARKPKEPSTPHKTLLTPNVSLRTSTRKAARREASLEIVPPSDESETEINQGSALERHSPLNEPPSESLPSHRARTAKPLVKMIDDPNSQGIDGAISVKTRILARHVAAARRSTKAGLRESLGDSQSPGASGSKPVSRPTRGVQKKNTSSLLTFDKGGLKTIKGKYTPAPPQNETQEQEAVSTTDSMNWETSDADQRTAAVLDVSEIENAGPSQPAPTSEELLRLAGLDTQTAGALPDFEDDPPAPVEKSISVLQQSIALAKDKLFPSGLSTASVTSAVNAAWKRSTIFGPLGLGSDKAVPITPTNASPTFLLTLDASTSIPVALVDLSSTFSGSQSLDYIVGKSPKGPPGKFYREQFALAVINTLRTGGHSARVVPAADAWDNQKLHFERFRARLDEGELFVAMAGVDLLAFCSSHNALMGQRLNVPAALLGLPGGVLVSRVIIENDSEYANAAFHADEARW